MPPKAPDFGSHDYWDQRFSQNTAPFDWLSTPQTLDPLVQEALSAVSDKRPRILHIGCGSSLLSQHLKTHVRHPLQQVHNVDYSEVVIRAEALRELEAENGTSGACCLWDAVDLLDYTSLVQVCTPSDYSVIIDKSTSDAISCADDVVCALPYAVTVGGSATAEMRVDVEPKEITVHPLHLLSVHLALVAKPGARWIALSYTAERYPFLEGEAAEIQEDGTADTGIPDPRLLWKVVDKHQIEAKQEETGEGVTHRPKVYHWVYILQRTSTTLVTCQKPDDP